MGGVSFFILRVLDRLKKLPWSTMTDLKSTVRACIILALDVSCSRYQQVLLVVCVVLIGWWLSSFRQCGDGNSSSRRNDRQGIARYRVGSPTQD